jgi:hypothetical protein
MADIVGTQATNYRFGLDNVAQRDIIKANEKKKYLAAAGSDSVSRHKRVHSN